MSRDLSVLDFDPAELAFGRDPREWHHRDEANGLTWRILRPEDMPQIHALWREMDADLGTQDKPDQFTMPVVLTVVAVDDRTGKIVSAVYGETVIDFTMIGQSRRAARSVHAVFPYLSIHLWARSIRIVRVLVPMRLRRHMRRFLPRFSDITDSTAQFVHKIRG